jgi:hypothetical protein
MNADKLIEGLAARARAERPPRVEVVERVMARLRAGQGASAHLEIEQPLLWTSAFSGLAAAAALVVAATQWHLWTSLMESALLDITGGLL